MTKEAASALLEDVPHIQSVVETKTPSRAQIRYLGTTLRRLLVDHELAAIASPRIGRFELLIPDNHPYLALEEFGPYRFFASGGAPIFGPMLRPITVRDTQNSTSMRREQAIIGDLALAARTVPVRLDNFLAQPVLCSEAQWASRRDVIKFVANVASSAHSDVPDTPGELLLARIRNIVSITSDGENVSVSIKAGLTPAPVEVSHEFQYKPDAIDVVLHELLSAAHYMLLSPDVQRLMEAIKTEFGRQP